MNDKPDPLVAPVVKMPKIVWQLGDPEQVTTSGVTITVRPIYHNGQHAGSIHRDHAEALMHALLKAGKV